MSGELPPGFRRTVGPLVGGLVRLTVMLLPPSDRLRYDAEFRAELLWAPPPRRAVQAAGLLVGAPSLRRALKEAPVVPTSLSSQRNWRCVLGRHHHVRVQDDNPENRKSAHLECTRCLHIKEFPEYTPMRPDRYISGL